MQSNTIGYNGKVLCAPFERKGLEAVQNNGFATAKHKTVLVGLKVIFGNGKDVWPDDIVFVKGDAQKSWGNEVVEVDGHQVCICPPDQIWAVKHEQRATSAPSPAFRDVS